MSRCVQPAFRLDRDRPFRDFSLPIVVCFSTSRRDQGVDSSSFERSRFSYEIYLLFFSFVGPKQPASARMRRTIAAWRKR